MLIRARGKDNKMDRHALSRDGKSIALSLGHQTFDVVLIKDFK
jgi:hypothetical protein